MVARCTQKDHATRLAKLQRRLRIFVDEHFFDRGIIGVKMVKHGPQFLVEHNQPARQWHFGVGFNFTIVDMRQAVAFLTDDAPASGPKAGVETQNNHDDMIIPASPSPRRTHRNCPRLSEHRRRLPEHQSFLAG